MFVGQILESSTAEQSLVHEIGATQLQTAGLALRLVCLRFCFLASLKLISTSRVRNMRYWYTAVTDKSLHGQPKRESSAPTHLHQLRQSCRG